VVEPKTEVVRRAFEAFNREDLEAARGLLHPDVEFHGTVGGLTEGEVAHGPNAVNETFEPSLEAWDEWRIEPEEIIDAGGDKVVVLSKERMRGQASGIELEAHTAAVVTVRDGRIASFQGYIDQDEALRAAGLEPRTGSSP
jgi:ketosteroid isomerase-like protein